MSTAQILDLHKKIEEVEAKIEEIVVKMEETDQILRDQPTTSRSPIVGEIKERCREHLEIFWKLRGTLKDQKEYLLELVESLEKEDYYQLMLAETEKRLQFLGEHRY